MEDEVKNLRTWIEFIKSYSVGKPVVTTIKFNEAQMNTIILMKDHYGLGPTKALRFCITCQYDVRVYRMKSCDYDFLIDNMETLHSAANL